MFKFKEINWAFVLVMTVVVVGGCFLVKFLTHEETITVTDDKGVTSTRNVTKIGMGTPSEPKGK